jgi:hypothetical protein
MMDENIKRVVVWFSAGVTSAIAAKISVDRWGEVLPVHVVNCDTGSEDEDNFRFMHDVCEWIDRPLEIIRNEKYEDTFDVYRDTNFIMNRYGAKCTLELKKKPRREYENLATDLQVFGYDSQEEKRANRFVYNNPEVKVSFPLIEEGITKRNAREQLMAAGIREPRTYSEGFKNANCLNRGCVKGAKGYWNHIRKVRPEVFWNMAKMEREVGFALNLINIDKKRRRIYLDELPPDAGNYKLEPKIECGLFCGEY